MSDLRHRVDGANGTAVILFRKAETAGGAL